MKKIISLLLSGIIVSTNIHNISAAIERKKEIFVQAGSIDGDGSFEKPFSDILEAKEYIRELKKRNEYPAEGINVNFREGTYYLNKGIVFDETDSGTEEAPVTYQAYGNEKVTFTGGVTIKLSEGKSPSDEGALIRINKDMQKNIIAFDLKEKGINEYGKLNPRGWGVHNFYNSEGNKPADEIAEWMNFSPGVAEPILSFGGEKMTLARYPNGDEMSSITKCIDRGMLFEDWSWTVQTSDYDKYGTYTTPDKKPKVKWEDAYGFTIKGDDDFTKRMKKWTNAKDVWAYGYWSHNWADLAGKIKSFDFEDGTFTMHHPYVSSYAPNVGQRFYFYNLLEELDAPGEWYLDRDTGILYFYPPQKNVNEITLAILEDSVFNLNGAHDIEFRKLNIESGRRNGIEINDGNNILVELCNIGIMGKNGVHIAKGNNCKVYSSYFYDSSQAIDSTGGDKDTLTASGNVFENNWSDGCEQGFSLRGVGDVMRNNRVHNSDEKGFYVAAPDVLVENNEFYDLGRRLSDMGIGYAYRNVSARGLVLKNNYFHDIESDEKNSTHTIMGFYGDEGFSGVTAISNLFVNFKGRCFMLNGGRNWTIKNNIAINCNEFTQVTGFMADLTTEGWNETYYNDFDAYEHLDVYKKYPGFEGLRNDEPMRPKYNLIEDNVIINTKDWEYRAFSSLPESTVIKDNNLNNSLKFTRDPGFENMDKENYILKEDSEIFKEIPDFEAPDFKNMGIYTPWLAYYMRDNLALAINSNIAYYGFEPEYVDENDRNVYPVILNDRTYLPIRFVSETLGAEVNYDDTTRTAHIEYDNDEFQININSGEILLNGTVLDEYKAVIRNGRTLVPIRVIEKVGKKVTWIDEGIIIIGDEETSIQADEKLVDELLRRLR